MKAEKTIVAVTLAFVFVEAGSTGAFVIDEDGEGHPLHWARTPVAYHLVPNNVPDGTDGEEAVHSAFRSWSEASGDVTLRFEGEVEEGTQHNDGRNVVYWIHDDWPYDPSLIASTFRTYDTRNGALIDTDVVLNGDGARWSIGGLFSYDIENTVAHEVGHLNGLGHSSVSRATMAQGTSHGETKKRTLAEDDVAGLDALYGKGRRTKELASSGGGAGSGGCTAVPGDLPLSGDVGGLVALLALLGLRARRPPSSIDTRRRAP